MDVKTKKFLVPFILVLIVIGVSALLGDYAATIMSTSTVVKNAMLCQIIFLVGIIAGIGIGYFLFRKETVPGSTQDA